MKRHFLIYIFLIGFLFSFYSTSTAEQDEDKIISTMKNIEQDWIRVFKNKKAYLFKCREDTWQLVRFLWGDSVTIDVLKTQSIISPYRGVIKFRGQLEVNGSSKKANGFINEFLGNNFNCFKTTIEALQTNEPNDWGPYTQDYPSIVYDFTIYYDVQKSMIQISGGNDVFINAVGKYISLPENYKEWSYLLSRPIN